MSTYSNYYIFEWLNDDDIYSIINYCKIRKYNTWDIIMKEWDVSNWEAYIIKSWVVNIFIENNFVAKIDTWNIFWEIALIREEPRSATAIAKEPLECIVIDADSIFELISKDNKLNKIIVNRIESNIEKNLWIFKG